MTREGGYIPLGRPTARPIIGSTISGLLYCNVVCRFRSIAWASASILELGGWEAGNVVEPKSHNLKVKPIGCDGDGDEPAGVDRTFSICS